MSQVCVAEGTTTYVKLEHAAKAAFRRPSESDLKDKYDDYKKNSKDKKKFIEELEDYFEETRKRIEKLVPTFALEPLQCSEEVWFCWLHA